MSELALSFNPNAKVIYQIQEPRVKSISTPPKEISAPNKRHLQRKLKIPRPRQLIWQ